MNLRISELAAAAGLSDDNLVAIVDLNEADPDDQNKSATLSLLRETMFAPETEGIGIGSSLAPFATLSLQGSGVFGTGSLTFTGAPTGHRTITFPDASITVARSDAAQTFTGIQTFSSRPVFPDGNGSEGGFNFSSGGPGIYRVSASTLGLITPGTTVYASNGSMIVGAEAGYSWSNANFNPGATVDLSLVRAGASVIRLANGSSGAASVLIAPSTASVGTSGAGVLVIGNGTAPSSSPADEVQVYAKDFAAGDSRLYVKSETGNTVAIGNGAIAVNEIKVVGAQQSFIADPSGGVMADTEARAAIVSILDALIAHGLIASS